MLDVKFGRAALYKDLNSARRLAQSLVRELLAFTLYYHYITSIIIMQHIYFFYYFWKLHPKFT